MPSVLGRSTSLSATDSPCGFLAVWLYASATCSSVSKVTEGISPASNHEDMRSLAE